MFTGERRKEGGGWRSVGPWWANSSLFAKFDEVIPESTSQDYSTTNLKKATTRFCSPSPTLPSCLALPGHTPGCIEKLWDCLQQHLLRLPVDFRRVPIHRATHSVQGHTRKPPREESREPKKKKPSRVQVMATTSRRGVAAGGPRTNRAPRINPTTFHV